MLGYIPYYEKTPLREIGRVDHKPQKEIRNAMEGVTFDYHYSGHRVGAAGQIEGASPISLQIGITTFIIGPADTWVIMKTGVIVSERIYSIIYWIWVWESC